MSEHPPDAPGPIDLDRPSQFPSMEESPRTSLWMLATQFFIAPMAIALAAICVFVIASVVSTRDPRGAKDIVAKIRDGGRNERTQASYDLAQYLNAARAKGETVSAEDTLEIIRLFDHLLALELDPARSLDDTDKTILRFLALCQGLVGDPRSGDPLVRALASRDAELRFNAIIALGKLGEARHAGDVGLLLGGAEEEASVRSVAAYALGSLLRADAPEPARGDPMWATSVARAREILAQAMERDRDALVRANAAVALAQTGDARAVPALSALIAAGAEASGGSGKGVAAAPGPDAPVSREQAVVQAIAAATRLGDPAVLPALETLEATTTNLALRIKAREAIASLRGHGK